MTKKQHEIALALSRLAASFAGNWISELKAMLSSPCPYMRTAALMLLRDLATGEMPPLPIHTVNRLAAEAKPVLETIDDPDLYTLCFRSLRTLSAAAKCQIPGDVLPVWVEQFRPSRN